MHSAAKIYVITALKVKFNGELSLFWVKNSSKSYIISNQWCYLFKIKPRPQEFSCSMGIINSDYHSTLEFFTGIIPGPNLEY